MKLLYLFEGYLMIFIYFMGIDTCKDIKNGKNYDVLIKENIKDTLEMDRLFKQYWTVSHFIYWLIIIFIQSYSKDRYMLISLGLGPIGNIILLIICHYSIYIKIKFLEIKEKSKLMTNEIRKLKNNKFNLVMFFVPIVLIICAIILNATLYNVMLSIKTFSGNDKSMVESILKVYNNSNVFNQVIKFPLISFIIIILFCIISKIIMKYNKELNKNLIPSTLYVLSIAIAAILEFFNIYSIKGEHPQILVIIVVVFTMISLPLIRLLIGIYIYFYKKRYNYNNKMLVSNLAILNKGNYFKNTIYYNRKNSALMIENVDGLSLQINFANLKVKYITLIIIVSTMCSIATMISNKVY